MIPVRDSIPSRTPPIMTWCLIGVNAVVFAYQLGLPPARLEAMVYWLGIVPARYSHPEWAKWVGLSIDDYWPFLTSMFLHGGWMHVLGNMWTLWIFGDNVEDRMGSGRFLLFYLLCGVASGVAHWLINADSTVPAIGASGAIAGVMGAYFLLFPTSRLILMVPIFIVPIFVEVPAIAYLALWFFLQFASGAFALIGPASASGIAFWAHVGGFVAGIVLLPFFILGRRQRRMERDEYGWKAAWSSHRRPPRRDFGNWS